MSDEVIKKVEKIIQDYGIEDGKPSEEVLKQMQKAIEEHKLNITPQEFAILEGRLKMRNTIIKDMQSAIEEAEKHTHPSPDTLRMYGDLKKEIEKQGKEHTSVHNILFEKVDKIDSKVDKLAEESHIRKELQIESNTIVKSIEEQTKKTNGRVSKAEDNIVLLEKNDIRTENSIKGIESALQDIKKYFDEKKKKEEERSENWANGWKSLFFDLLKYISIGLIGGIPTAVTAVIYIINMAK